MLHFVGNRWPAPQLRSWQGTVRRGPPHPTGLSSHVWSLQAAGVQRFPGRGGECRFGYVRAFIFYVLAATEVAVRCTGHGGFSQMRAGGLLPNCAAGKALCGADPRIPQGCPKTCGVCVDGETEVLEDLRCKPKQVQENLQAFILACDGSAHVMELVRRRLTPSIWDAFVAMSL